MKTKGVREGQIWGSVLNPSHLPMFPSKPILKHIPLATVNHLALLCYVFSLPWHSMS